MLATETGQSHGQNDGRITGIIGGSGLYQLLSSGVPAGVETPYGAPSDAIVRGEMAGRHVLFLPRHGVGHTIPPHMINYRANIWALHALGAQAVISVTAVGSLREDHAPGDLVCCDQYMDATHSRAGTFFDGPEVRHTSMVDPFCPIWRQVAVSEGRSAGMRVHDGGCVVTIQGPRYSTRAESRRFAACGADVIGMTQCPEVALARELGMCYLMLGLITDYDAGLETSPAVPPVSEKQVVAAMEENLGRVRQIVERVVARAPVETACSACGAA